MRQQVLDNNMGDVAKPPPNILLLTEFAQAKSPSFTIHKYDENGENGIKEVLNPLNYLLTYPFITLQYITFQSTLSQYPISNF